jgi:hypothetical protein
MTDFEILFLFTCERTNENRQHEDRISLLLSFQNNESGKEVLRKTNRLFIFDKTRTAYKTTPPTIIRCRANNFTELLPGNDRGIRRQTHIQTRLTSICYRENVFNEPLPSND